jgi:GNAT superfamily N-acetyltransferase
METRAVTPADLPAIRELASLGEAEGFRFVRRFADQLEAGTVQLDSRDEFFFAVFDCLTLLAVGGVTRDPYVDDPRAGRLRHVFVRKEWRGTGIGRRLVTELEVRAADRYTYLRLRTDSVRAAEFYEHLGYMPTAEATATHERSLRASWAAANLTKSDR